jgi:hypothetical protein
MIQPFGFGLIGFHWGIVYWRIAFKADDLHDEKRFLPLKRSLYSVIKSEIAADPQSLFRVMEHWCLEETHPCIPNIS